MKKQITAYVCDKCEKKLKGWKNELDICTDLRKDNPWSRLHIKIIHSHGVHNNATNEPADLCQDCVITLLNDALNRVKKGERATAGTQEIEMGRW